MKCPCGCHAAAYRAPGHECNVGVWRPGPGGVRRLVRITCPDLVHKLALDLERRRDFAARYRAARKAFREA